MRKGVRCYPLLRYRKCKKQKTNNLLVSGRPLMKRAGSGSVIQWYGSTDPYPEHRSKCDFNLHKWVWSTVLVSTTFTEICMLSRRGLTVFIKTLELHPHRLDYKKFGSGIESGAIHLRHSALFSCREFEPEKAAFRRDEPLTRYRNNTWMMKKLLQL